MAICFMIMINIQVRMKPEIAPQRTETVSMKEKVYSLKNVWPFLVIFLISIGGIYVGVFTPNEAGAIGAMGAFILSVVTRRMSLKILLDSLDETLRITVMIFFVLIGASIFGRFLALSKIPMLLSDSITSLDVAPFVILTLILVVYFFLGMFLEGIAIMVLTLPIVYPIITDLGYNGLWFGVIMILIVNIGVLTPPLGLSVYIIAGIVKHVSIEQIFKGVIPSIITMILFIILLIIFPEIVTFLPDITFK